MKTIVISSFHPLISRNILMAGIPRMLVERGHRVILVVPEEKEEYFRERYGGSNIFICGVSSKINKLDITLRSVALLLTPTRAMHIKRCAETHLPKFIFSLRESAIVLLQNIPGLRLLARHIDYLLLRDLRFEEMFKIYRPDIICATDIQNEIDVRLIHAGKKKNVKTIGLIRSWDNITSKGILRAIPDVVCVPTTIVANELQTLARIPKKKIYVIGVPHHDYYWKYQNTASYDGFCARWNLDSQLPTILFAPIGDRYITENTLDREVLQKLIEVPVNILVRMPPTDTVACLEGINPTKHLSFHHTGVRLWKKNRSDGASKKNEIGEDDERLLREELAHVHVLVTGQSTMVIDAAIFDVPAVIIAFDSEVRPYCASMRRYYDYEYYTPILQSKAIAFITKKEQFVVSVERSLRGSKDKKNDRQSIAELQSPHGGNARTQLVEVILSAFV